MSEQNNLTVPKIDIADADTVALLKSSYSFIDPKTIGRKGCVEIMELTEKAAGDQMKSGNLDIINFELPEIPDYQEWKKMKDHSFADIFLSHERPDLWRTRCRLTNVSAPRILKSTVTFQEGSVIDERFLMCSATLEDGNGTTMQCSPIFQKHLLRKIMRHRGPRQMWDILGVVYTADSHFMFGVLDAEPILNSEPSPIYSNPDQYNISLDILRHYAGKQVKIDQIKAEIEERFQTELSYFKVWRAINEISERKVKGGEGSTFQIPTSSDDEHAHSALATKFIDQKIENQMETI